MKGTARAAALTAALAASALGQEARPDPEPPATIAAAFARAGDNRGELERAWRDVPAAQRDALAFLLAHMPDADARALTAGFLLREVQLAHDARGAVPWGATLDDALFLGYVVPYAQANERREDWRSGFQARFLPLVRECRSPGAAAVVLNASIFDALGVRYSTGRARADQAPSESIAQGKASCTGLSILLADACRACCVPARVVSVRWPHQAGNHTWVEVWDGAAWRFVGAGEPDPAGLDRAWFVGDAARAATATREHRIWAVSFARTADRFAAGWARGVELWGTDESDRYALPARIAATAGDGEVLPALVAVAGGDALKAQLVRFFAADAERQATFEFDRNLDAVLKAQAGDAHLRALAFAAWREHERTLLQPDFAASRVRAGGLESAYVVRQVGERPAGGWPLVVAMHGGGGVPQRVNDSQWRHMQGYYRDHPEAGGYLYCALRAPNDEWNGFYFDGFHPLLERLVRQFVVCGGVDPDRVIAIGYSHGGYGAFAVGPKLPHRFAAVHASAAAPTDGESSPVGLHTLAFSFMVGGNDTAYGRRERCERFAGELRALQAAEPSRYPATFTLVEGNGHTGLPDRDLLAQLVPRVRTALPRRLAWALTDRVVCDHYWLRTDAPARGARVDATLAGNRLAVTKSAGLAVQAWLDARLVDLAQDLVVDAGGTTTSIAPAPSLRTLCTTLQQRGDPALAASWIVPVP